MNINFLVIFCFVSAFKTIASENNGNRNIIEEFINRLITNKEAENHGSICKFKAEDLLATIKDIVNKQITEFCTASKF